MRDDVLVAVRVLLWHRLQQRAVGGRGRRPRALLLLLLCAPDKLAEPKTGAAA
jgi:hypothetical protein